MKKVILSDTFIGGIVLVGMLFLFGLCGRIENNYSLNATVVAIENNTVTFKDTQGECWDYDTDSTKDFSIGTTVKLTMFTNYTDNTILDDEIEKIKIVKKGK